MFTFYIPFCFWLKMFSVEVEWRWGPVLIKIITLILETSLGLGCIHTGVPSERYQITHQLSFPLKSNVTSESAAQSVLHQLWFALFTQSLHCSGFSWKSHTCGHITEKKKKIRCLGDGSRTKSSWGKLLIKCPFAVCSSYITHELQKGIQSGHLRKVLVLNLSGSWSPPGRRRSHVAALEQL